MIPWLESDTPSTVNALDTSGKGVSKALTVEAPGLLAAGADLSPPRLLQASRSSPC